MIEGETETPAVTYEAMNGVGYLTLSRPARLNAIDAEMAVALLAAYREAVADNGTCVIVIRGLGKSFCAGGDLSYFRQFGDRTDAMIDTLLPYLHEMLEDMELTDKAVVLSVHGAVAGAGMSLSFMGDFCVAEAGTRFVPAYPAIGVTPDAGGTAGLVRAVGIRNAMKLLLAGDAFDVDTAHTLGLVTKIAPQGELQTATARFAERLAGLGSEVFAETRRLLREAGGATRREQLDREMDALKARMRSPQFHAKLASLGKGRR
ncbi:MAG: enoyl-CoA hydratase/isomerase family protein [Ectothiorhodospiraceae bacterium]|nr:enoyl-CoA hydratase/isomerase family protein [Ectothiorhodospiraceae bacterium]